jgi:hypothetical protein
MRKAVIANLNDKGAFLIDSGIGRAVPGEQIHKLKSGAGNARRVILALPR